MLVKLFKDFFMKRVSLDSVEENLIRPAALQETLPKITELSFGP
jgi:hypothetical protein